MRDSGDGDRLGARDILGLVRDTCRRAGFAAPVARAVARSVLMAERAGARRLGLGLLPQMIEHARAGRVDPAAVPMLEVIAPAVLRVDAAGGFACPAFAAMLDDLSARAAQHGLACAEVVNAYPAPSLAAFAAVADRRGLSLVADVQGLVPRPTPSGRIALAIGPVAHGVAAASDPLPPARLPSDHPAAPEAPDFEGPVGPAFRLTHRIILLDRRIWPQDAPTMREKATESGIAVPTSLLQKIVTA